MRFTALFFVAKFKSSSLAFSSFFYDVRMGIWICSSGSVRTVDSCRQFRHSLMRRTHAFAVNNRRKLVLLFLILPCSGHADVMHKPCIKQRELTISERTSRHSFTGASHSFTHSLWIVLISLVSTDGLCVSLCTLLSDPWF